MDFREPARVTFDEHRWYTLVTILDRFGCTRVIRIGDHDGDGVYCREVLASDPDQLADGSGSVID